jgi:hypothetical protein
VTEKKKEAVQDFGPGKKEEQSSPYNLVVLLSTETFQTTTQGRDTQTEQSNDNEWNHSKD